MRNLVACKDCDRVFFWIRIHDAPDACRDCGNDGKGSGRWYRKVEVLVR